jgi:transposase InsO family protein
MTWKEATLMSTRLEFVLLAQRPNANIAALCRGYGISRKTAYKWIERYRLEGEAGLRDLSRKPHTSPATLSDDLEQRILELNERYPYWGARKLRALLPAGAATPHHSTVSAVLSRHNRRVLGTPTKIAPEAPLRFEHPAPNLLWQIDFKGHFALTDKHAGNCHPLTILDDHSRFNLCLAACANQWRSTVQEAMTQTFLHYGLPERITTDNGPPWGMTGRAGLTQLEVWWIRLGIRVSHSRPYHPQTQGKDERFHRTLKMELLERQGFNSLAACQAAFDGWRDRYNPLRPHEALGQRPPVSRYEASGRQLPLALPAIEYEPDDAVRKVNHKGEISYQSRRIFVGEGLQKQTVAVRPATVDGVFDIYFCHHQIRQIDLRDDK